MAWRRSAVRRRGFAALLALASLTPLASLAQPAAPAQAVQGCEILSRGHWADASGNATLAQAIEQRFEPVGPVLSEGYDAGAHWLRLLLRCEPGAVLRLPPAFLDHVDVHQQDASGAWQLQRRGDRVDDPQAAWPATPRVDMLPPTHDAAGAALPSTVYLRVHTTSASLIDVQALGRQQADRRDNAETAAIWGYLGVVLALTAWALLAVHRRERALAGCFVAYQLTGAVTVLALTGQMGALWPALEPARHLAGSLAAIASAAAGALFCRLLLAPGRAPAVRWLPSLAAAALALCGLAFLAGAQRQALHAVQGAIAVVGAWCWWVALTRPAGAPRDEGLKRVAFALIGASALVTAGRHLGGWTVGGAGTYGAPLNYGVTALLMFSLLVVRDRRGRAADRALRRRLDVERALARERSEQLESKTQLLAMLEHELKSPLTLLQFALAEGQPPQAGVAREAVHDITEVVERTVQIDQLDAGRWQAGEHRRLRLAPWLDALLRSQRAPTAPAPRVVIAVDDALCVDADELMLRIIVGNLLENACRYGDATQPVRVEAERGAAGLLLRISNAVGSCGRPDPARLFERYYRAPRAQRLRGTGLGLWLSRALARRLGGDLRLLPEPNRVIFELCLPTPPTTPTPS